MAQNDYVSEYSGAQIDEAVGRALNPDTTPTANSDELITSGGVKAALDTKYVKPGSGIPKTDLASGVQTSLGKADTAYQKPGSGVPKTDLESAVRTSLDKADAALPAANVKQATGNSQTDVMSQKAVTDGLSEKYVKPSDGIPKSDLASGVQGSLNRADASPVEPGGAPSAILGGIAEDGTMSAEGQGSFAYGNVGEGSSISAHGDGSTAFGKVAAAEGEENSIAAEGDGATAFGYADGNEDTVIDAVGDGSLAHGYIGGAAGGRMIASGKGAHAEGYADEEGSMEAMGNGSHTEGYATTAKNDYEHAQGIANESHNGSTRDKKTIFSIGIGYPTDEHGTNAVEVMRSGDMYVKGIGGYDGHTLENAKTLQKIHEETESRIVDMEMRKGICEGIADTISNGTPQEFVFRKSGGDGVNYLKRIKGKSLVWNQLLTPPANSAAVATNIVTQVAYDSDTKICTLTGNGSVQFGPSNMGASQSGRKWISGHKYYMAFRMSKTNAAIEVKISRSVAASATLDVPVDSFAKAAAIVTAQFSSDGYATLGFANLGENDNVQMVNNKMICVDLTRLFGAGNEPSTVAEFEALYPELYYPNNDGELICNDAKYLETVGFNQWDEEWELGSINGTGANQAATDQIRSKNYIPAIPSTTYYFKTVSGITIGDVFFYDINKNFISGAYTKGNQTFTTPDNCYYIRIAPKTNYGSTYNNDICINLSDATRNGQYEPYWKRVLPVNCDSFKVKSHNIWDEEWEVGYFYDSSGSLLYSSSTSTCIRSKNMIPVKPNTTYYGKTGNGYLYRVAQFDSNGDYISGSANFYNASSALSFTTGASACYIKFMTESYGVTYNNNICINLSSPFNGQYEPHGEITVNGLRGVGTAFDEKTATKYVKRMGRVDLGTPTWGRSSQSDYTGGARATNLTSLGVKENALAICSKYIPRGEGNGAWIADQYAGMFTIGTSGSGSIGVNDPELVGKDAAQTKAYLSGVYIDYELATPIEYELVEPCFPAIMVDSEGVECAIFPEHSDGSPSAPFNADSNYSIGIKNLVAKLSE